MFRTSNSRNEAAIEANDEQITSVDCLQACKQEGICRDQPLSFRTPFRAWKLWITSAKVHAHNTSIVANETNCEWVCAHLPRLHTVEWGYFHEALSMKDGLKRNSSFWVQSSMWSNRISKFWEEILNISNSLFVSLSFISRSQDTVKIELTNRNCANLSVIRFSPIHTIVPHKNHPLCHSKTERERER